jgi:uncharacterized protein with HEPN domain
MVGRKVRDNYLLIVDILEAIQNINEYTYGLSFEDFSKDKKTKDAVIRNFEIIGEASNKLSNHFKKEHSEIEWKSMTNFRNVIIHEYFGVDIDIMWNIISTKLPSLYDNIKNILDRKPPLDYKKG